MKQEGNFVYILHCCDDTLYTGWTNDLSNRIKAHNAGKGAKYTKTRLPVTLAYFEVLETKSDALKREHEIKNYPREKKMELVKRFQTK